jgi:hypothetical protein
MEELFTEEIKIGSIYYDKDRRVVQLNSTANPKCNVYIVSRVDTVGTFNEDNFFEKPYAESSIVTLRYLNASTADFSKVNLPKSELTNLEVISAEKAIEMFSKESEKAIECISPYVSILRRMFPGKTVTKVENGEIYSYIHIDEQVVTSSSGNKTTIRDFVFRIKFAKNGVCLANINAQVFTATRKQAMAEYAHSHVQRLGINQFASCCFGNTPLNSTYARIKTNLTESNFELFMLQLMDWIKYESLGSGPFVRMSSIHTVGNMNRYIDKTLLNDAFNNLLRSGDGKFKISLSKENGRIKCSFDKKTLNQALIDYGYVGNSYVGKIIDGSYVPPVTPHNHILNRVDDFLNAHDLDVKDEHCSINLSKNLYNYNSSKDEFENSEVHIDPIFLDAFEKLHRKYFELYVLNRINNEIKTNNIEEPVTEGQLPS